MYCSAAGFRFWLQNAEKVGTPKSGDESPHSKRVARNYGTFAGFSI